MVSGLTRISSQLFLAILFLALLPRLARLVPRKLSVISFFEFQELDLVLSMGPLCPALSTSRNLLLDFTPSSTSTFCGLPAVRLLSYSASSIYFSLTSPKLSSSLPADSEFSPPTSPSPSLPTLSFPADSLFIIFSIHPSSKFSLHKNPSTSTPLLSNSPKNL